MINQSNNQGMALNQCTITAKMRELEDLAISQRNQIQRDLGVDFTDEALDFVSQTLVETLSRPYNHLPSSASLIFTKVSQRVDKEGAKIFLRLVILQAILLTIRKRLAKPLPRILAANQVENFERILSGRDMNEDWLALDKDLFQKEFGIASERLFASGSNLLDKNCGVPRSILAKNGFFDIPFNLLYFIRLGGFKPLVQIHAHTFILNKFNKAGRDECYMGCVELYKLYPELLGAFGSSWFYDPEVAKVSPRLRYLQDVPISGGAKVLYYSVGDAVVNNAISKSKTRRSLYEQKKYAPKNFMMIWGKKQQTEWFDQITA